MFLYSYLFSGPNVISILKKRLAHKDNNVVSLALTLCDFLVKNCHAFHRYVGDQKFLDCIVKSLPKKIRAPNDKVLFELNKKTPTVQQRARYEQTLLLLQTWAQVFSRSSTLPSFRHTYQAMLRKGVRFPMPENDAPVLTPSSTNAKAAQASQGGGSARSRPAPKEAEPTFTDAKCAYSYNSAKLLVDSLSATNLTGREILRDPFIAELSQNAVACQKAVMQRLQANPPDTILAELLLVNDICHDAVNYLRGRVAGTVSKRVIPIPEPEPEPVTAASGIPQNSKILNNHSQQQTSSDVKESKVAQGAVVTPARAAPADLSSFSFAPPPEQGNLAAAIEPTKKHKHKKKKKETKIEEPSFDLNVDFAAFSNPTPITSTNPPSHTSSSSPPQASSEHQSKQTSLPQSSTQVSSSKSSSKDKNMSSGFSEIDFAPLAHRSAGTEPADPNVLASFALAPPPEDIVTNINKEKKHKKKKEKRSKSPARLTQGPVAGAGTTGTQNASDPFDMNNLFSSLTAEPLPQELESSIQTQTTVPVPVTSSVSTPAVVKDDDDDDWDAAFDALGDR